MAKNGDKTMHSSEHLISNKALRLLEQVGIREHRSCCAPINDWVFRIAPADTELIMEAKGLYVRKYTYKLTSRF